jgi:preprotein translocase subunit SecD
LPRNLKLRFALIAALVLVSFWYLIPTIRLYSMSAAEREELVRRDPEAAQKLRERAIKLGLDLQGGMHLVLEIDETDRKLSAQDKSRAIDQILEVIRNRVNQFGVAEPLIQKVGNDRIIVELPGVENEERAKELVQQAAYLEFQLVRETRDAAALIQRLDGALRLARARGETPAAEDTLQASGRAGAQHEAPLQGPAARTESGASTSAGGAARALVANAPATDAAAPTRAAGVPAARQPEQGQDTAAAPRKPDSIAAKPDTAGQESDTTREAGSLESLIRGDTGAAAESAAAPGAPPAGEDTFSGVIQADPSTGDMVVPVDEIPKVKSWLSLPSVQAAIPDDVELVFSSGLGEQVQFSGGKPYQRVYLLDKKPLMTGEAIATANAGFDQQFQNRPIVSLTMTPRGRSLFARITGAHVNDRLAIVLDGVVRMAPRIIQRISEGRAQITGFDSPEEANVIAIVLQAGALQAPVKVIEERTVGPSLGSDSIQAGRRAFTLGLVAVVLFMIVYYRWSGAIADFALVLNTVFLMAALVLIDATLTLPGIAGVILTVGMAIDANVLIFERVREELDAGKSVRTALDLGYEKAWATILDSHVTTLIVGVVLLQFGTGPVKGFGITLSIGILFSLFTAIFVTRAIFDAWLRNRSPQTLSI